MPTERVIEIPWAMMALPQSGKVLDVGSCDATYLHIIQQHDRQLFCMDPRDCLQTLPAGATFYRDNLIGNQLPGNAFDAVLLLSTLEHIGMPCYGNSAFECGDQLAVAEIWRLLKPGGRALVTVPAGKDKVTTWYRQYSPDKLAVLFDGWVTSIDYWGFVEGRYVPVLPAQVTEFDYRDYPVIGSGAGVVACVIAEAQK